MRQKPQFNKNVNRSVNTDVGIYLIHDSLTRLNEPFRVCLLSTIQSLQAASAAVIRRVSSPCAFHVHITRGIPHPSLPLDHLVRHHNGMQQSLIIKKSFASSPHIVREACRIKCSPSLGMIVNYRPNGLIMACMQQ